MTVRTTSEPAIRVRGLEKLYKQLEALRGVDFEVARGSIFALLKPNGAGKTTVIKILSTLLKPDAGTATVAGFDVATHLAKVRESISLTGQFAAVDEILTGRENLILVAWLRRLKDPGRIADDLLARFQLTDAATRRVATYSGGMTAPGHRHEPHRASTGDLPGRADHRARPPRSPRGVADGQGTRHPGHDGAVDHPVPGGGRRDSPTGSRSCRRKLDHRQRHPG